MQQEGKKGQIGYINFSLYRTKISLKHRQADDIFSEELSPVDGVKDFVNNYEMDAVKTMEFDVMPHSFYFSYTSLNLY